MSEVTLLADQMEHLFSDAGHWHAPVSLALKGLDAQAAAYRVEGFPNSAWELVSHMRWEIELVLNRLTGSPAPAPGNGRWQNWPAAGDPGDAAAWEAEVAGLFAANRTLVAHLRTLADADLHSPPPGRNTIRRRVLLGMAGHSSYHVGQIIMLRRMQGNWADWTP